MSRSDSPTGALGKPNIQAVTTKGYGPPNERTMRYLVSANQPLSCDALGSARARSCRRRQRAPRQAAKRSKLSRPAFANSMNRPNRTQRPTPLNPRYHAFRGPLRAREGELSTLSKRISCHTQRLWITRSQTSLDWRSDGLIDFGRHFDDGCCWASNFLRTSSARLRNSSCSF
jgi:hypothetical protein